MSILLGAIGDDITGSTDLALMLAANGMSTLQFMGVPGKAIQGLDCQAAVVALKSRTAPLDKAISQSLEACDWLTRQGARQIFFKYCSTFDSTERGNIGPVTEALLNHIDTPLTVVCPAFPTNQRTVFQGHLFVGDRLLAESGMRHHPLTPMRDSDLVRFLGKQVSDPQRVALVSYDLIDQGSAAIEKALADYRQQGKRLVVLDALKDEHLVQAGRACANLKLITGGSGIAMGLPQNFKAQGRLDANAGFAELPKLSGHAAVLAGSCAITTLGQVATMANTHPALPVDPLALHNGEQTLEQILYWARKHMASGPILIYASDHPATVAKIQAQLGRERAGAIVENCLGVVAQGLVEMGVDKLVVAGGETSGAVLQALELEALQIGPEIDPGVPWTIGIGKEPICLALKSGNFGTDDFFIKALEMLP